MRDARAADRRRVGVHRAVPADPRVRPVPRAATAAVDTGRLKALLAGMRCPGFPADGLCWPWTSTRRRTSPASPAMSAGLEPPDHALEPLPQLLGIRAVLADRQVRPDGLPLRVRQLHSRHGRRTTGPCLTTRANRQIAHDPIRALDTLTVDDGRPAPRHRRRARNPPTASRVQPRRSRRAARTPGRGCSRQSCRRSRPGRWW